jgi:3-oxoacyl-[acyl-carrier protein] reductase
VLINNAGYSVERGLNVDMTLEQAEEIWNDQVSINLTGAFLMTLAELLHLPRPGGHIINISPDAALTGGPGIRLPGAIMTEPMPEEAIKSITAMLPLRRVDNVNDIASAALFLASPEAGFITGELMNINGGRVFGC